jgi:Tfp pilus assembly protein PilF
MTTSILAQAFLQNEHYADAARHVEVAVQKQDEASYGHLIRAIAEARMGNSAQAQAQYQLALDNWPAAFET